MRYAKRFMSMFMTAVMMLFLGLDLCPSPKAMIVITCVACGLVNMLMCWLEDKTDV